VTTMTVITMIHPVSRSRPRLSALSGSLRLATSPVPGEVEFPSAGADPHRQRGGRPRNGSGRPQPGGGPAPLPVRERVCALRRRERAPRPRTHAKCALIPALLALAAAGCRKEKPDAYGNFEAEEVVVSAELAGRLLRFEPAEGERLAAGAEVALIDTATLALQRQEIATQRGASQARTTEAQAQIGVLQAQLATAQREYDRTRRLYRAEAATAQQLDRTEGEVRVLRERIRAAQAQIGTVREEASGAASRLAQIGEQLGKSRVVNPVAGTVLTTYAKPGEFVQGGAPLYKIADLDTLTLRAYVSGAQLASVRVGGPVQVRIDAGKDRLATLPGRLSWVASEAEFTPTPIQTADERTDQVYAVKIRVPNRNGVLKIGMPGEVILPGAPRKPRG
jgi:HlyD family secretion protein